MARYSTDTKRDCWSESILQGALPFFPFAYHNHSFKTCGVPEASTTNVKKCGVRISSVGQKRYLLESDLEQVLSGRDSYLTYISVMYDGVVLL